jgi:riboflavin synthase
MFTGIVVETGTVLRARARKGTLELEIQAPGVAREVSVGDSVSVNGVCLTAVHAGRRSMRFEAIEETLARSSLGDLKRGGAVNLELPARLVDRLGGHLVQGHVDGIGRVVRIEDEEDARRIWFEAPNELLRYMVGKGSIALDGVSLTIVDVGVKTFQVALIPHTLKATTLGSLQVGSIVNVEVDVIAKYVERLTDGRNN